MGKSERKGLPVEVSQFSFVRQYAPESPLDEIIVIPRAASFAYSVFTLFI